MFLWGTLSPLAAKGEIVDSKNIIGKVEYPGHQKPPIILQVPTKAENAYEFATGDFKETVDWEKATWYVAPNDNQFEDEEDV